MATVDWSLYLYTFVVRVGALEVVWKCSALVIVSRGFWEERCVGEAGRPVGLQIKVLLPEAWEEVRVRDGGRWYSTTVKVPGAQRCWLQLRAHPPLPFTRVAELDARLREMVQGVTANSGVLLREEHGDSTLGRMYTNVRRHPEYGVVAVMASAGFGGMIVGTYEQGDDDGGVGRELADSIDIMQSADLVEIDLEGLASPAHLEFAHPSVIQRMPVTWALRFPLHGNWTDATECGSDKEPYAFERASRPGRRRARLRVWTGVDRDGRVPHESAQGLLDFLRRHATLCEYVSEQLAVADSHPFGQFATAAFRSEEEGIAQVWALSRPDAYVFAKYTLGDVDEVSQEMQECNEMVYFTELDEEGGAAGAQ